MLFRALSSMEDWEWVRERTHAIRCEDSQGIVASDDNGIAAICIADSFSPDSCCLHLAIDRPVAIRRGFLHEVARHLFVACRRSHIFGMVPATNAKSLKFAKHVGFREICRIPDGCGTGVDYIVMRIDKDGCRWLAHLEEEVAA